MMHVRGREGQVAWWLHRITGLGVLVFLCMHVVDTSMLLLGETAYNHLLKTVYQAWWFQPMEIALGGALVYHTLNGLRVILLDFWEDAIRYDRQLRQGLLGVYVISMAALSLVMLWPFFVRTAAATP
jgi:succinate dehydrogenase / fumarate reductase cytochrome b subunit